MDSLTSTRLRVERGANTLTTAVEETKFHREEFLRATAEGPMMLPMRVVVAALHGNLHDLRGLRHKHAAVFKPSLLSHCRQERQLIYEWDGRKIIKVYQLREFLKIKPAR